MVFGCLVGGRGHHRDAVVVGVVDRFTGEDGVVVGTERLLDHVHAAVGRVQHGLGEAVGVGDERLSDTQLGDLAVGAGAGLTGARVGFPGGVLLLAGPVSVMDLVVGVVVVVDKVPAGDVGGISVVVVVDAVGEGDDQVLGCHEPGGPVAAVASGRRVGALGVVLDDVGHARVAGVVEQVEDALFDHVVGDRAAATGFSSGHGAVGVVVAPGGRTRLFTVDMGGGIEGLAHVHLRGGQLAGVEQHLRAEQQHRAAVVPFDARVELGDPHVRAPEGDVEGGVNRCACGDARACPRGHRGVGVDKAHTGDTAELVHL